MLSHNHYLTLMKIKFPVQTGSIQTVDVSYYEDIIHNYLNVIQGQKGIISVIQIGSFTAPGLSDIDIVVVVDENDFPAWDKISLVLNSQDMPHNEVLMHDIFVIPSSISKYIESFFYVDQQTVLFGDKIGGLIPTEEVSRYKVLIAFEYSVHRLDVLMSMLKKQEISFREVLLFVSTLRHTYRMLSDLRLVDLVEAESKIIEIEKLRKDALRGKTHNLDAWAEKSIKLLHMACSILGEKMYGALNTNVPVTNWILSNKKLIVNVEDEQIVGLWKKILKLQQAAKLPRFVFIIPLSSYIYHHVQNYLNLSSNEGAYLRAEFNGKSENFIKVSEEYQQLLAKRAEMVVSHWKFIDRTGYFKASGRGYIIFSKPTELGYRGIIKFTFLRLIKFLFDLSGR